MKTLAKIVGIGLLGGFGLGGPLRSWADLEVAASVRIQARADFEVPLTSHGTWVQVRTHGRCWRPAGVAVSWRPYCDGHWVWTDCGWYWESDEPWAWACYHYGRWVFDSELGWFWVPDIEWSPAWVYWRVGGGFIGWAPCPPRGVIIAPPLFSFVAVARFHDRVRPSSVVINDVTIINQTKEITAIKRANRTIGGARQKVVINEGPGVAVVQKAVGREIHAVPIQEVARRSPFPRSEAREAAPPAEKAGKHAPESIRPAAGTPEPATKPNPRDAAPAKDQTVRPSDDSKKTESPSVEPPRPRDGKGQKPDFGRRKERGHNKGKP